jgi:hypothetical protein
MCTDPKPRVIQCVINITETWYDNHIKQKSCN